MEQNLSEELLKRFTNGYIFSEQVCLICESNVLLIMKKSVLKESNNYMMNIQSELKDVIYHFKKLPTPSCDKASHFFSEFQNLENIENSKKTDLHVHF